MKPTTQPKNSFASLIRRARAKLKMNQVEASNRLGIPLGTYVNWEQGRTEPDRFKQMAVLGRM